MKTKLLLLLISVAALGYSQVQPTVHNATFDNIPKSSGSDCSCSGWINKDIADQGESSTVSGNSVGKLDNLESDGFYQEVAVVANSVYTLDLEYKFNSDPTTTTGFEVYVLKGSAYVGGYVPAYDLPADAAQDGFGYETVAQVEMAANQLAFSTTAPPGDTDFNSITQMSFNTGSETSIAIFIRAVGPYDAGSHGDPSKDKGWMNGDSEVRLDNLVLTNTTVLSTKDILASNFNIYPNPAKDFINIKSSSAAISSVKIYDLLGKQVRAEDNLQNSKIDVSDIASGIYLMKINSDLGSLTRKIVIR